MKTAINLLINVIVLTFRNKIVESGMILENGNWMDRRKKRIYL